VEGFFTVGEFVDGLFVNLSGLVGIFVDGLRVVGMRVKGSGLVGRLLVGLNVVGARVKGSGLVGRLVVGLNVVGILVNGNLVEGFFVTGFLVVGRLDVGGRPGDSLGLRATGVFVFGVMAIHCSLKQYIFSPHGVPSATICNDGEYTIIQNELSEG
jgi:hypothetical protein